MAALSFVWLHRRVTLTEITLKKKHKREVSPLVDGADHELVDMFSFRGQVNLPYIIIHVHNDNNDRPGLERGSSLPTPVQR